MDFNAEVFKLKPLICSVIFYEVCTENILLFGFLFQNKHSFNFPERAGSPDIRRPNDTNSIGVSRSKLRRSRSACDIRDMRPIKRPELTLAPIPAKTTRLASACVTNNSAVSIQPFSSNSATSKPPRIGHVAVSSTATAKKMCATKSQNTAGVGHNGPGRIASTNKATSTTVTKKGIGASTTTSISTTGAGKSINKRIPPYDFKARYNDLLEKFKVLKAKFEEKCEQMGAMEGVPEQLEESQDQLFKTKEELKNIYTERDCLGQQIKSLKMKIDSISALCVKTKDELDFVTNEHKVGIDYLKKIWFLVVKCIYFLIDLERNTHDH